MTASGRSRSPPGVAEPQLRQAYAQAKKYLRRPYVTGIGIGLARRQGQLADMAICIFVTAKIPDDRLPSRSRLPREIAGVAVDVVVCQLRGHHKTCHAAGTANAGPVRPGMMIGDGQRYGTVGLIARDGKSQRPLALSCAHVLPGPKGSQVYQPADASPDNRCGTRGAGLWNLDGDVALVQLSRPADNLVDDAGFALTAPRGVILGEVLDKRGYVSGLVTGRVSHFGIKTVIYGDHAPVRIEGFYLEAIGNGRNISQAGDSGAVWHDPDTGAAIGIEVAGDPGDLDHSGNFAFAGHVVTAFSRLDLVPLA